MPEHLQAPLQEWVQYALQHEDLTDYDDDGFVHEIRLWLKFCGVSLPAAANH